MDRKGDRSTFYVLNVLPARRIDRHQMGSFAYDAGKSFGRVD
jgi:hypothetical protein